MTIYKAYAVESKAVNAEEGIYEAFVSTEDVDRDEDIILADGVDVSNYLGKNPVIPFGHNYFDPKAVVARTLEIAKIPGRGVKLLFQFVKRGVSETADLVHDLWKDGFLNAMSIGFISKKSSPRRDENGEPLERGILFEEIEMLEGSIVTIPANQNALRAALEAKGLDFGNLIGKQGMGEHVSAMQKLHSQMGGHLDDMTEMMEEGKGESAPITKRGRVLSARNEKRIREAVEMLSSVLGELGEEEEVDDAKNLPALPKTVIPYRDTGTADEGAEWSAPNLGDFTDETFDDLSDAEKRRIANHYTWTANNPPQAFGDLKLPHHRPAKTGIGPSIWRGVAAAMAALQGGRGGIDVPDSDRRGIFNHLSAHYRQYDKEPPELRALEPSDASNIDDSPHAENAEEDEFARSLNQYLEQLSRRINNYDYTS